MGKASFILGIIGVVLAAGALGIIIAGLLMKKTTYFE
jgi:hypothetical protein